jgi:hypothetical protein
MNCPDCGEEMVKVYVNLKVSGWMPAWLCGCLLPKGDIEAIDELAEGDVVTEGEPRE